MSDFVWSIFIGIGIVGIAMGIVAWMTVRRLREEKARTKQDDTAEYVWLFGYGDGVSEDA